ncbi:disrupted in schizophrenia 1 protein [Bombina bombina]|uniref:disrupted in schizophrenia 1 protein n=1 Tax=Bombina bombina TaxID=8345 RepID=UPI00235A9FE0|nr:disrupted in schizophrenia 1 protein [Bombina bombina]
MAKNPDNSLELCCHKRIPTKKPGYLRTEARWDIELQSLETGKLLSSLLGKNKKPCKNRVQNKLQRTESNSMSCITDTSLKVTNNIIHFGNFEECFRKPFDYTASPGTIETSSGQTNSIQLCRQIIPEKMNKDPDYAKGIKTNNMSVLGQKTTSRSCDEQTSPLIGAFKSSFSFIQQSLDSEMKNKATFPDSEQTPLENASSGPTNSTHQGPQDYFIDGFSCNNFKFSPWNSNSNIESAPPAWQNTDKDKFFKMNTDGETEFFCSTDSVAKPAYSFTSGYSSNSASESGWDTLIRKYEPLILECTQRNQSAVKVKALILELQQRLHKAVEEDNFSEADTLRTIIEDKQKNTSIFCLPSRHPLVCNFLNMLQCEIQKAMHQSIYRNSGAQTTDYCSNVQLDLFSNEINYASFTRKEALISKRDKLQKEIEDIKTRLELLEAKDQQLKMEIEEQNNVSNNQKKEIAFLLGSMALGDLQEICNGLKETLDLSLQLTRSLEITESLKRLYEKELSLCCLKKEANAQVCTNQQLCTILQRKVNDIEMQIPSYLKDIMFDIEGNNFCVSKDFTEELKSLRFQKNWLEKLLNEILQKTKNVQYLDNLQKTYSKLKQNLTEEENAFKKRVKELAVRYVNILEEKLLCCRNQLLGRVWEADLEACQLLIREIHLKGADSKAFDARESQTDEAEAACDVCLDPGIKMEHFYPKAKEWVAARKSYQHKYNEVEEEVNPDLMELLKECESVNKHLVYLEEQLQHVNSNHDDGHIHILSAVNNLYLV